MNELDEVDQWVDEEFAGICDLHHPQYGIERQRFMLIYYDAYSMQHELNTYPSEYSIYSYSWLV